MDEPMKRRLALNEVLERQSNEKAQRRIRKDMSDEDFRSLKLHFYCECARPDCTDRIIISSAEYRAAHKTNKQFIAIPGHENVEIETIIAKKRNYIVIEKYVDPAKLAMPRS